VEGEKLREEDSTFKKGRSMGNKKKRLEEICKIHTGLTVRCASVAITQKKEEDYAETNDVTVCRKKGLPLERERNDSQERSRGESKLICFKHEKRVTKKKRPAQTLNPP